MKKIIGKKGLLYLIAMMLISVFVFSQIAAWAGEESLSAEVPGEEEILEGEELEELESTPEIEEEETLETPTEAVSDEETVTEDPTVEETTTAEETEAAEEPAIPEETTEEVESVIEISGDSVVETTEEVTEETEELELAEVTEETTTVAETTKAPEVTRPAESPQTETKATTDAKAKTEKEETDSVKNESAKAEKSTKKSNDQKTLATPKLLSANNTPDGVEITWSPVEGADWYYIYYWNTTKQKYVKFGWTYDTSFVDTKAKSGKMYYYTVYAVAYGETKSKSDYIWSDCSYAGIKGMYLTPVKTIRAYPDSNGATLTWDKVKGADGYWLYWRKPGTTKWNYFKKVTKNSYYDKTAKPGKTYEYLVQPYAKLKGTTFSAYYDDSYGNELTMAVTGMTDMNSRAQFYSSSTNYLIMVDCGENRFGIYTRGNGGWELFKYWQCTTGSGGSPTCKGVYTINYKGYSFGTADYTCYYFSSFNGPYLIHSTKYYPGTFEDKDARLGMSLSGGCVRLAIENAKYVYDYIPVGTTVVTYIN